MTEWKIKRFDELSAREVYDVLVLRCEVFIVEQNCPYQDPDGKDEKGLHLLGYEDGILVAYARLFGPGDYLQESCIGRVVVRQSHRDLKLGHRLMEKSLEIMAEHFPLPIKIHAQSYLQTFYETHGFAVCGDEFLEDGIPHLPMIIR